MSILCEGKRNALNERNVVKFQGVGRTLGGSGGSNDGSGSSSPMAPESVAIPIQTNQTGSAAQAPSPSLVIDETVPTSSIQLRLADGTCLVAKFNHHHTINGIRGFIDSSRPGAPLNYQLQTMGFPPKPLTDLTQTIEQAGLANSVVLEFKNFLTNHSTAEIDLGRLQTWRPTSDCCKWQLVKCDARSPSREVIHLNLSSLVQPSIVSVSSSILRPVLRVNSLVTLDVSSNSIRGEIPGDAFVNLTTKTMPRFIATGSLIPPVIQILPIHQESL